ncbi:MAG: ABC transporter permease [Shimia sp.]|nr:ABC transporter permease [Shimia sp.]MCH2068136.1 ABC transporter permease [Shimia sp.]
MSFLNVIRRRLMFLILVLFGVTVITFTISNLIPGDPARMIAGDRATPEIVQNIREALGLDKPLPVQYVRYLEGVVQGDFGTSIRTRRPVLEDLRIFFPATLELALTALLFATALGIPLGVASAVWKDKPIDHFVRVIAVTGISTPAFWLGLLVILLFYGNLGWLPSGGRIDPSLEMPTRVTGFLMIDSLLAGDLQAFGSALKHILLPAFTLGFVHLGVVARQVRGHAGRAAARLYPHRQGQWPQPLQDCLHRGTAQRHDPFDHCAGSRAGRPALRDGVDRNRLRLAWHGRLCGELYSGVGFPSGHGLHRGGLAGLCADQLGG